MMPESVVLEDGVSFATRDGAVLRYDAFVPAAGAGFPTVFCIHGGGWVSGSTQQMHPIASLLAANGFAAFCLPYRLAPSVRFPKPLHDVYDGAAAVLAEADRWRIDSSRKASLGYSAGGHMAAMLALAAPRKIAFRCVVDLCGIADVGSPDLFNHPVCRTFLPEFMGWSVSERPDLYAEASPIRHVRSDPPAFFLAHGLADSVVPASQTESLARTLQRAGGEVELYLLPDEDHSFTWRTWQFVESKFLSFLRKHLL